MYKRKCLKCNSELTYKNKKTFDRAVKSNSVCKSCSLKLKPRGWMLKDKRNSEKSAKSRTGLKKSKETRQKISASHMGKKMIYKNRDEFRKKISNTLKGRSVTWGDKISKSLKKYHNKNRNKIDETNKIEYYKVVRRITRRQPIHLLKNYDKRGRAGTKGAYHLDHIISKKYGFDNGIPPESIGHISNLRYITWEENIKKGELCLI